MDPWGLENCAPAICAKINLLMDYAAMLEGALAV